MEQQHSQSNLAAQQAHRSMNNSPLGLTPSRKNLQKSTDLERRSMMSGCSVEKIRYA